MHRNVSKGQAAHSTFLRPALEQPCDDHTTKIEGGEAMTQPTEKEIKNRAYEIWERNGRPKGREDEFWQQAEQELRNEDKSSPIRTPDNL
jgi:hypothetical protein